MKQSRKGVISLPIKLMVSFLIISLMVPTLMATVDNVQGEMDNREMFDIAEELRSQMSKVSSRGSSFVLQTELRIPSNGHIVVGGEDGRIISIYKHDDHIGNIYTDFMVANEKIVLYGDVLLQIYNSDEGVVVKEI